MDAAKALNRNSFLAFSALVLQQIALRHNQDIYFNSPSPADLCATKPSTRNSTLLPQMVSIILKDLLFLSLNTPRKAYRTTLFSQQSIQYTRKLCS